VLAHELRLAEPRWGRLTMTIASKRAFSRASEHERAFSRAGRHGLCAALMGLAATFAGGCSDVESCIEGVDEGCLGSNPDNSGNCRFGLVRSADGFNCVKPGDQGEVRNDGGTPPRNDGGANTDSCTCPSKNACLQDGGCVDLCLPLANPPVLKDAPLSCRPVENEGAYDFARAARGYCSQAGTRRSVACNSAFDPATECSAAAAQLLLTTQCPTRDPECAMKACEAARDTPCSQQQCAAGAAPNCTGVLCSDNCDMPLFNLDGVCDDGDLSTAISYVCEYGTDCGDCGPRRGSAPPFDLDYGDPCVDPGQCGGDLYNVKSSTGWCVPPTDSQDVARCIADCSVSRRCRSGFECIGLSYPDPDGSGPMKGDPVLDLEDGTEVYACFPLQCGN
jgi:hypothetical protein